LSACKQVTVRVVGRPDITLDICDASAHPDWHENKDAPTTRDLRLDAVTLGDLPQTPQHLIPLLTFRPWPWELREHVVVCALRAGYLQALTPKGNERFTPGGKYHGRFRKANGHHLFNARPKVRGRAGWGV
jgi:hypothetical protein